MTIITITTVTTTTNTAFLKKTNKVLVGIFYLKSYSLEKNAVFSLRIETLSQD